jgi:hypothetical protein
MSQIFHPNMNIIARASLLGAGLVLAGLAGLGYLLVESPYVTHVGLVQEQPVPFSHQQHVGELGLDCRYCHSSVETTDFAGIPSTQVCMGCHTQVAVEASSLEPVRASLANDRPLEWIRVHDLPDFVYFNHGIHVSQGIGCESCHGRVDQMPVIAKMETLRMDWCLACHRAPERFIRPRAAVFTMGWEPAPDQAGQGPQLVAEYGIEVEPLDDCSICHR